ncbi:MAG: calcium-binding protein, partial [Actinomycetes bacterium]
MMMTAGLTAIVAIAAFPGAVRASTLTYDAGTRVLTLTGTDADNIVFADHPEGDTARMRIVDVGEELTASGAPECTPDDISFYFVCPTPAKLVLQLNGGADAFSDETTGGGQLTGVPIEAHGGAGADEIDGGEGPDALYGGADADTLLGGAGADALDGGDGADTLHGGTGDDDLAGALGHDRLTGGLGNDAVRGGDGDDELDYSPEYVMDGSDLFEGGPGFDAVGYFGRTAPVTVVLDGQAQDGQSGENDNVAADIEAVDGGDAADVLIGSPGPDGLAGRGGNDQISGDGGDDDILGDSGNDTLSGDDGADSLDGGCHDDDITGGPGVDSLNSDGTCESPDLRGANDVLRARDGVRDALVLCTMSGPAGDTAIVDPDDPALPAGNAGACRTIDAGSATGGTGTTTDPTT